MPLTLYKHQGSYLRRAAFGNLWARAPQCCCVTTDCPVTHCCDRHEPETGEADDLPTTFESQVLAYTCDCLDNISLTHEVPCIDGITDRQFIWNGAGSNEWEMVGNVLCDGDIGTEEEPIISETCEVSSVKYRLVCGSNTECEDWFLEIDTTGAGCENLRALPQPGGTCDPFDMTFIMPLVGCNCTPGNPTPLCDCTVTFRIYEVP